MTLALHADQDARYRRSHLAKVDLVSIAGGPRDEPVTIYLSTLGVRFDGNVYEPFLSRVRPGAVSINHLPAPADLAGLRQPLTLEISNEPRATERVLAYLEGQLERLEGAVVEWSQVALEDPPSGAFVDLDALGYASGERTVRWRGRVSRVGPVSTQSIELGCEIRTPSYKWPTADGANTDPRDRGVRLPVAVGLARKVRAVNYSVGWRTTTTSLLESGATPNNFSVTDASGFPDSGSFTLRIGNEKITASKVDDTTVNITARGVDSTADVDHFEGDQVDELQSETVFLLSGQPSEALEAVYARSPFGSLVRFGLGTVNLADTDLITGHTVTSLTLTQAEMEQLIDLLQAEVTDAVPIDSVTIDGSSPAVQTGLSDQRVNAVLPDHLDGIGTSSDDGIRWSLSSADTSTVVRWRLFMTATLTNFNPLRIAAKARTNSMAGGDSGQLTLQSSIGASGQQKSGVTNWVTPSSGQTVASLIASANIDTWATRPGSTDIGSGDDVVIDEIGIELEVENAGSSTILTSSGFGLEVFGDLSGVPAPAGTTALETVYDFDSATGWAANAAEVSGDSGTFVEGTASINLRTPTPSLISDTPASASGWADPDLAGPGASDTVGVSVESDADLGENVVQFDFTGSAGAGDTQILSFKALGGGPFDLSDALATIDLKVILASGLAPEDFYVEVYLLEDDDPEVYGRWRVTGAAAPVNGPMVAAAEGVPRGKWTDGSWFTLACFNERPVEAVGGYDGSAVAAIGFGLFYTGEDAGTTTPDAQLRYRLARQFTEIESGGVLRAQANNLSAADLSDWRVAAIRQRGLPANIARVTVYTSDTTGSGTTPPTDRNEVTWVMEGAPLEWLDPQERVPVAQGSGSTDLSVDTIGFEIDWTAIHNEGTVQTPVHDNSRPKLSLDDLRARRVDGGSPAYEAEAGLAMEHPADILRWWLEEIGGELVDTTAHAVAAAALEGLYLAGDLRAAGLTWEDVSARLGFESNANLVPGFTSSGVEWKILAPRSGDLGWLTAGDTLPTVSEWDAGGLVQVGRDTARDLRTRFLFAYAPDWSRGDGEEAFTAGLLSTPDENAIPFVTLGDLGSLEQSLGRAQPADPVGFRLIQEEETAKIVAAHKVRELIRLARLFAVAGAPWWEVYNVEVGDLIQVAAPPWGDSAIDARAIEVQHDPGTEQRELRLVEVTV